MSFAVHFVSAQTRGRAHPLGDPRPTCPTTTPTTTPKS